MNPTEPRLLRVEVVADLPVLWATLERLDLPGTLDRHFPAPRNWKGPLTPGEVLAVWLLFILSQGDHCLNHVEPWVAQHQGTLSSLLGKEVLPSCAHDDRLADWLTRLGASDSFSVLERDLNQQTILVYQLPTDLVRIDTTTANSYAEVLSQQGLLQFGHSKDDPDRPQLKIAAGVLDPLGMPPVTAVVPGNSTDDPLHVPIIQAVQQSLGVGGRTYVGDCKMAALATRAFVAAGADLYLCPLSENQIGRAERHKLLQPVWHGTQALEQVWRPGAEGQPDELVAEGFSLDVELTATVDETAVRWTERRWLVRSQAYAQAPEAALERRLGRATQALRELVVRKRGKKQLFHAELMEAAQAIVTREGVDGLLSYTAQALMTTRQVRAYRDRRSAAGDGGVLRDRRVSRRDADQGKEEGDGLAGIRYECLGAGVGAGGVGLPGPVSDRGRLVTAEGPAFGIDPDVPAGRAEDARAGVSVESGVARAELAGVGGARTTATGGSEVTGSLCRSVGPQDGASQRRTAAEGDEDNQRQCGRGQRTDARHVVTVD